MIPYAILSGKLYIGKSEWLEIRILELSPESFTFRLSPEDVPENFGKAWIVLQFLKPDRSGYRRVEVREEELEIRRIAEENPEFWIEFSAEIRSAEFRAAALDLMRSYMDYVENRLTLDDAELSEVMTGYPAAEDEVFPADPQEQRMLWADDVRRGFKQESWEWISQNRSEDGAALHAILETDRIIHEEGQIHTALLLENPAQVREYLQSSGTACSRARWEKSGLSFHPLAQVCPTTVMAGNSFCPNLVPGSETCIEIFRKAEQEGCGCALILPPVPESRIDEILHLLRKVAEDLAERSRSADLLAGDPGILRYVRENYSNVFHAESGILMNKKRKDPRMKYLQGTSEPDCTSSYLFYPLYQTNTATFCTLRAAVLHGDRGAQERAAACSCPCLEREFRYPEHLRMLGRYNSLFGFDAEILQDGNVFREALRGHTAVMNLQGGPDE